LYTASKATAVISIHEEVEVDAPLEESLDQESGAFLARIGELNADLPGLYHGGIEALERGGTDWQRHAMTSFRELATHTLHLLAPDKVVTAIAKPTDIVNGKPTRAVRFNYIFGDAQNGAVSKFYQADMKAAIELFEVLNRGTHELGNRATPGQVRYLRSRLVGLVTSMLDARHER
jgi:hypothetical protein